MEDVWKNSDNFPIQICNNCLNSWLESGNLIYLISNDVIVEEGTIKESNNEPESNILETNTDDGDAGPAPLQNTNIPHKEFEGIVNFGESNDSGNTDLASTT